MLTWNLFSEQFSARLLAALVPLVLTARFAFIGLGWLDDPAVVQSLTRHGDRREILRGPLFYGLVFILSTVAFWRHAPAGLLALMLMCGGDGLAEVVGRRWGRTPLPFNPAKSWMGSLAMFAGGFLFAWVFLLLFNAFGNFDPRLTLGPMTGATLAIAALATAVEALPLRDVDNLTITAVALLLGSAWL